MQNQKPARLREKSSKTAIRSKSIRWIKTLKFRRKTKSHCKFTQLEKEIKKAKKKQKPLTTVKILNFLKCAPYFIGCFAENELANIAITSYPSFLIVNIDKLGMKGSHWIALGIFRKKIEIFDSLGFTIFNWSRVPCNLLTLQHKFSQTRNVVHFKRIQSDESILCGYYCIFYVTHRLFTTFTVLEKIFTSNLPANDDILLKFFS